MKQKINTRIQYYNRLLPLLVDLVPLIGDKKEVKIADIGSGPFSTIGRTLDGVKVEIFSSDKSNFDASWKKWGVTPLFPVEIQNMEKLTYEDNFFDVVVSINAMDHTHDALAAVEEAHRVTKGGGWIYLDLYLYQMDTGHKHFWNVTEEGMFVSRRGSFNLKDLGFNIKLIDNHGLRRHNHIIATCQKNDY